MSAEPYDAGRYWQKRLGLHFDLWGAGHSAMGIAFNRWAYRVRTDAVSRAIRNHGIELNRARVLDVGFGTGFWLEFFSDRGAEVLCGCDIVPAAVANAERRFPNGRFYCMDLTQPFSLGETFDIVLAMDVLYHIVDDSGFRTALLNIVSHCAPGGYIALTDAFCGKAMRVAQHTKFRPLSSYRNVFRTVQVEVLDVLPVFFWMNSTVCAANAGAMGVVSRALWRLLSKWLRVLRPLPAIREATGRIFGAALYPLEAITLRLIEATPSTSLLVARKGPRRRCGSGH